MSASTSFEVSSRYLATESPQRVTSRAGPTGTPSAAPGEAQPQVRAADAQVAGDGDLGAAADAGAVAGGDRRLREAGELVVERRRTAPSGARWPSSSSCSRTSAPAERPMWSVEESTSDADLVVVAGARQVGEQLLEHLRC